MPSWILPLIELASLILGVIKKGEDPTDAELAHLSAQAQHKIELARMKRRARP